ncbi:MAG: tRNA epoxyqueuosine(34) reductase QueG [Saprospirales bacterium]|nr:tRNA epoxyqueuosine(34) reductase QueG [Saprospirales bacterium]
MPGKYKSAAMIREEARRLGFDWVGFARVRKLEEEEDRLQEWLNRGLNGKMAYMANHFEMRLDPGKLVPGAKTVVVLMHNYFPKEKQKDPEAPRLARYAFGEDYHFVLKKKLKSLLRFINDEIGEVHGRCFTDSAPVMERQWAALAGLGWTGRNTLLIHPRAGSYYFLAELIIDLELPADEPIRDHCGTCRRCIDACPTEAIAESGYLLDASKCISYLTIELREAIPEEFRGKMQNWMFGCDVCQEVCPWNRFSRPHDEPAFFPKEELLEMKKSDWLELTEEVFKGLFRRSAVKRTGYSGLKRNLDFLYGNQ